MAQRCELVEAELQQICVISHTDDVGEHCRLHIRVRRENGVNGEPAGMERRDGAKTYRTQMSDCPDAVIS